MNKSLPLILRDKYFRVVSIEEESKKVTAECSNCALKGISLLISGTPRSNYSFTRHLKNKHADEAEEYNKELLILNPNQNPFRTKKKNKIHGDERSNNELRSENEDSNYSFNNDHGHGQDNSDSSTKVTKPKPSSKVKISKANKPTSSKIIVEEKVKSLENEVENLKGTIEDLRDILDKKLQIFNKFVTDQIELQNRFNRAEKYILEEALLEMSNLSPQKKQNFSNNEKRARKGNEFESNDEDDDDENLGDYLSPSPSEEKNENSKSKSKRKRKKNHKKAKLENEKYPGEIVVKLEKEDEMTDFEDEEEEMEEEDPLRDEEGEDSASNSEEENKSSGLTRKKKKLFSAQKDDNELNKSEDPIWDLFKLSCELGSRKKKVNCLGCQNEVFGRRVDIYALKKHLNECEKLHEYCVINGINMEKLQFG